MKRLFLKLTSGETIGIRLDLIDFVQDIDFSGRLVTVHYWTEEGLVLLDCLSSADTITKVIASHGEGIYAK